MAIIDVIRFDGLKSRDWLIYKAPVEDIVTGGQLIVQEGQRAIFVKHGMAADTFGPGTYKLTTENLPILRRLVEIPFGGNTPFSAEVYFINTVVRLDIYWGLTDPIQLIDPKYHIKLRLRAFGQMNLSVADGDFVFKNVIGGMQKAEIVNFDKVKSYFRGMIVNKVKALLSETIINDGVSALEISAKIEILSNQVQEKIEPLLNEYGFKCSHFYIQSINFPDEDFASINKILEDKAAFEIMGESRYRDTFVKCFLILLYVVAYWISFKSGVTCIWKKIFNIPCPGCGYTHAVISALKLDFRTAYQYHPMFWAFPVIVALFLKNGLLFKREILNQITIWGLFIMFGITWITRIV